MAQLRRSDCVTLKAFKGRFGFGGFMLEGLFQPTHLLVIFFVALLVFGPKSCQSWVKVWAKGSAH